ncbi:methyltransferase [Clostridia bacterium]|nr:methyltransferase [Clostridia bacterium]
MDLNTIYNADCLTGMQVIPPRSIDLVVTDPPYLISYKTNYRRDKAHDFCSEIMNDDNEQLIVDYVEECYRIMKQDTAMYMFCSSKTLDFFKLTAEKAGFKVKNIIVWVKNNWTAGDLTAQFGQQYEPILLLNKGRRPFNGERISDVWNFPRVAGKQQLHQNQKPVELIERCILKHSNEGEVVFDGFMGSGTTAIAAINTERHYIGFELDPKYFDIANKRVFEARWQVRRIRDG